MTACDRKLLPLLTRSAYHGYDTDVFGGIPPLTVRSFVGRGRVTPDETIEQIKATYALNGNARETSRVLGLSFETVRKYIGQDDKDEFSQIRSVKRAEIIPDIYAKCGQVQMQLLDSMVESESLKKASLQEKATAFGIVTDKMLLITGQPTSRVHTIDESVSTLTPEEMEQAAIIRERFANAELAHV